MTLVLQLNPVLSLQLVEQMLNSFLRLTSKTLFVVLKKASFFSVYWSASTVQKSTKSML